MPDPYRARVARAARPEVLSVLDTFVRRLQVLGASPDEIDDFTAQWDVFDDGWTPADQARVLAMSDEEIHADLVLARQEWADGQRDEAAARDHEWELRLRNADAEVAEVLGRSVARVLEWVGTDLARATVALARETGTDGGNRKSLVPLLIAAVEAD